MKYAVLILGLLAASYANAQNHLEDFSRKRSLKQDGLHLQFMVLDADKKGVRNHHPSKFYCWTKAQHVRVTQGASAGLLLDGLFEAFYPDKQLAQKGNYQKGLKHGVWSYWSQDGTFYKKEKWCRGVLSGKQQYFDEKGQLESTEIIHGAGLKKRVTSDSIIHWRSFDRKTIVLLDDSGKKMEVQNFKEDELHGVQKTYAEGKLQSKVRYKKGETSEKEQEDKEEESEGNLEEEPGKLKQTWQKLFKKKSEEEKEKRPKEKERKERKSKKDKTTASEKDRKQGNAD